MCKQNLVKCFGPRPLLCTCVSTRAKLFQIVCCRTQSVWAVFSFPRCSVYNLLGVNLLHLDLKSECLVISRDEMTIFDAHVSIILGARRRPVWKSKGSEGEEEACF